MATPAIHPVASLSLDLSNFRHLPQSTEAEAVKAIIAIDQDRFWALAKSLLDDGYHTNESILLLKTSKGEKVLTVKEGNRRIAAIKLILGILKVKDLDIPANVQADIKGITKERKDDLTAVPCLVYESTEMAVLDRILTRIHGKGDKAARTEWTAVAKARHARVKDASGEPGLDLLEHYLATGKNFSQIQKEKWAGDYPLTVLDEALQKLAPRFNLKGKREVADHALKGKLKTNFADLLFAIGEGTFTFKKLRDAEKNLLTTKFGFPDLPTDASATGGGTSGTTSNTAGTSGGQGAGATGSSAASPGASGQGGGTAPQPAAPKKAKALALNDPQSVIQQLKKFKPVGKNRGKVTSLVKEAVMLNLEADGQPHAFCFLLRSMFEISAKAYCDDHASDPNGPKAVKADGDDRKLVDVLRDVTAHLKNGSSDRGMVKRLHGAGTELTNPEGILSVTSMNQLVHNPKFSVTGANISTVFNNIFPLLEALNS